MGVAIHVAGHCGFTH